MKNQNFRAMIVAETEPGTFTRTISSRNVDNLPPGDLLVKVYYSSLNFKDALSATGRPGVTRKYPHTPGIDAAGEVVESSNPVFSPGDKVIVTGYDLGMDTDGGYGQYIRIPSKWALPLPAGLSLRESMITGTAGFTAGLSVLKLQQNGVQSGDGEILVTGATGGVGSIAVTILARAGYRVVAATGKETEHDFLRSLGASDVVTRDAVLGGAQRPLTKERWAGVVDVVGGPMLAAALKSTRYGGTVTCCGLVGSPELAVNVFPFILRGVSLLGIDSVQCPRSERLAVWEKLAAEWKPADLEAIASECTLQTLEEPIQKILSGALRGRTVVNLLQS
jgi:putative YhdH/YhfP family quinone oxidoreductase